jgi:CBS domain-containing protein
MLKVEQVMTKTVRACGPDEPLSTAAAIMWQHDCGCVPIVDEDRHVLGMVTDRDICMAGLTQRKPAHELPVTLPMSDKVWSCRPTDTVDLAERTMREKRVRRLPVLDTSNRLVGILSFADIVREAKGKSAEISETDVRDTIAAIGTPHRRP